MKKVFLIILVAVFGATGANAQLNFGVKAGLNVADISGAEGANPKMGLHVGAAARYLLSPEMGIETGLYYSMLGTKMDITKPLIPGVSNVNIKAKGTLSPSYIQLPISYFYKFNVGTDLYLCPSAGIYLGYGIAGKAKTEVSIDGNISGFNISDYIDEDDLGKREIDYFGKNSVFNRFDFGVGAAVNLQYSQFTIGVGYDLGLTKINKESVSGEKDGKNLNLKVSVGYFF